MTAKERKTLQDMYRALEELPGKIREDKPGLDIGHTEAMARGADRARVLVYTWLREANMVPPGGR